MRNSLKPIIAPGFLGISIPIALGLFLWIVGHFFYLYSFPDEIPWLISLFPISTLVGELICFSVTLIIGFILTHLIEQFSIIRTRTLLPAFFFVFLMSTNPALHLAQSGLIGALILLLAVGQFLPMYQDKKAVQCAFNVMFILSVGSFIVVELALFIPVFLIGFSIYQSFSFRTISASLIGLIAPIFVIFSGFYLWSNVQILIQYFLKGWHFQFFFPLEIRTFIYFSLLVIIFFISTLNFMVDSHQEKIRTRRTLQFFIFLFFVSAILLLFKGNNWTQIAPMASIFLVSLISHFFSLEAGRFSLIVFWILILSSLVYFIHLLFFTP